MSTIIDKLAWIHIVNRKILSTRSFGKDTYYIPGGKREYGETDTMALLREIKEELNVELIPETLKFFNQFEAQAHGKPAGTIVRMTCYTADYIGEICASAEIEETIWLKYSDRPHISPVDQIIFDHLLKHDYID